MSQRRRLLTWGIGFSAITGILLSVIATRFVQYMPEITSAKAFIFLTTGLFSHFTGLTLLFFALIILPSALLIPKAGRLIRELSVLAASLGTVLLIADTVVYAQYRFHITGFVFEMLIQGGNQIIDLSILTWATIVLALVGIYLVYFKLDKWIWHNHQLALFSQHKSKFVAFFFLCFFSSHFIHLYADAQYDQRVTSLVRHVPMFSPATGKKALLNTGLIDAQSIRENRHEFTLSEKTNVVYPKKAVLTKAPESPVNVMVVLIDSARFDMLDKNIMPNYWAFSQGPSSHFFAQHISGGNSTRTGVFNMFYGIPGTYWDAFSSSQTPPVLMDAFQQHQYDISIHAAAPLTQPAFDRTVFAKVEDFPLSTPGETPWQRDQQITDDWLQFLNKQQTATPTKPFFSFLFYDGIHGFSVPDDAEKPFQPALHRIEHLSLNDDYDPTAYFNFYKNAAYQVDKQLGRVFEQLKQSNLLDNTIVIVTSDHGQEFNDNGLGYWGHGSNFTPTQVHVPFVIHWPGKEKAHIEYRTTHSDISVTLMEGVFNTPNDKQDYSLGNNLYSTERPSWSIVGSYVNYAVLEPDYQVVTYQTGHYEVLDHSARPLPDQTINSATSIDVMKALSYFYKD